MSLSFSLPVDIGVPALKLEDEVHELEVGLILLELASRELMLSLCHQVLITVKHGLSVQHLRYFSF